MDDVLLIAIPALYVAGAAATALGPFWVPLLARIDRQERSPDLAVVTSWAAIAVAGLATLLAARCWASPTVVLFGPETTARWGLYVDGFAGPMLFAFASSVLVAALAAVLLPQGPPVSLAALYLFGASGTVLILAQNARMLAFALETLVIAASAVAAATAPVEDRRRVATRVFLGLQLGLGMAAAAAYRLARLDALGRKGINVMPITLEDLRPCVAFASPALLGSVLALLSFGALVGMLAPWALHRRRPVIGDLAAPGQVALASGLLIALGCAVLRVGFHTLPFDYWEHRSSLLPFLSASVALGGAVWALCPGEASARLLRVPVADVGVLGLMLSIGRKPMAGQCAVLILALAAGRLALIVASRQPNSGSRPARPATLFAAGSVTAAYGYAIVSVAHDGWALGTALLMVAAILVVAGTLAVALRRSVVGTGGDVRQTALAAGAFALVALILVVAVLGDGAGAITELFRLDRTFIGPLGPGGAGS